MSAQDEVRWVLETIRDNYVGDESFGADIVRRDMDESVTLDPTERREVKPDLKGQAIVAATFGGEVDRVPQGTAPRFDIVTRVDVRIEAMHESQFGLVATKNDMLQIANHVRAAVDQERVYPDVQPAAESVGRVTYYNALAGTLEDASNEGADYFRRDFPVFMRGLTNPHQ